MQVPNLLSLPSFSLPCRRHKNRAPRVGRRSVRMAPFRASRPGVPMQSGMQSEQARRWEAALDRARDDDWIHYATVSGWLASCLRRRQWARFALCGGVLMVLLHLTRSAAHVRHLPQASDDVPDADDHDDIVDARGAQVLPSSSPPPATATKTVWATRRPLAGNDYYCEDSDGMGSDACQIRCGAPCLEPFRLCMAHEACHVVALNREGTFATLKTSLPGRATWVGAVACRNVKEWRTWLGKTVGGSEPILPGQGAALEAQLSSSAPARAISLALGPVRGAQDYRCAESDGSLFSACQVRCESAVRTHRNPNPTPNPNPNPDPDPNPNPDPSPHPHPHPNPHANPSRRRSRSSSSRSAC